MSLPSSIAEFGWFGAGWAVFKGGTDDPDFYPPIDNSEALRHWLAGFGAPNLQRSPAAVLIGYAGVSGSAS